MSYSSVKGTVARGASGLLAFAQRQLDRVVSADARQMTYNAVIGFAQERPFLAVCPSLHRFHRCCCHAFVCLGFLMVLSYRRDLFSVISAPVLFLLSPSHSSTC